MTETSGPRFGVYSATARIAPALLAAGPALALGIFALPLLPGAQKLWSLLALGLTTYAALVARKAGNRVQPELWSNWGGAPTARRFRYRESVSAAEIDRRHRDLEQALGDMVKLPTAADEAADADTADSEYQQVVRRFIAEVRNDSTYPLLNAENRNYGFARNLYGLKSFGVRCSWAVLVIALITGAILGIVDEWRASSPLAFPAVASLIALILWRQVDEDYVRPSAEAYADRVLEAAQQKARKLG